MYRTHSLRLSRHPKTPSPFFIMTSTESPYSGDLFHAIINYDYSKFLNCIKDLTFDEINVRDVHGQSLLHKAVYQNNLDLIKKLIDIGIDVNAQDIDGSTALHVASYEYGSDVIQCLLDAGADVKIFNRFRQTPILSAILGDNLEAIQLLLNAGSSLDEQDWDGDTALSCAIGNPDLLQFLLDAGANPNLCDYKKRTALHYAIKYNCKDDTKILIDAGADINSKDINNRTPLNYAIYINSLKLVRLLIGSGADVDVKDIHGQYLLHKAVQRTTDTEIITELLNAGVVVNVQDYMNFTPLHYAVHGDHPDKVKVLLDAGADVTIKNDDKKLAWDYINQSSVEKIRFMKDLSHNYDSESST